MSKKRAPMSKKAATAAKKTASAALVKQAGFSLVNVDTTVILEKPKLKNYREAIRESLARALASRCGTALSLTLPLTSSAVICTLAMTPPAGMSPRPVAYR